MEDYKQKYKERLEKAKSKIKGDKDHVLYEDDILDIFPELKESEDERIKEAITKTLKRIPARKIECFGVTKDSVYAWLEKQGEKTDIIENFDTEFEKQVSRLIASAINKEHEYNQGYIKWAANALLNYAKHELEKQDEHKCDCKYVGCHVNNMKRWCHKKQSEILYDKCNIKCSEYLKQREQKSAAWSEEDENMLQKALSTIRYALSIPAEKEDDPCFVGSSTIAWLKSLKERMKGE